MENHHIIIGWNKRSEQLINKIIEHGEEEGIVIIDNSLQKLPEYLHENVVYIKGDASHQHILSEAHIQHAQTVIITSDPSLEEEEADKYSILFTLAVKGANPNVRIITEILTRKQAENAKRVGATTIIKTYELLGGLLYRGFHNNSVLGRKRTKS